MRYVWVQVYFAPWIDIKGDRPLKMNQVKLTWCPRYRENRRDPVAVLLLSVSEDWSNEFTLISMIHQILSSRWTSEHKLTLCGNLTVTPYLRAIPCRVSLSVTRCSMNFSPREAVTLAVLPYERILVRARLWDSSLSDSEPDLDRGKMGWPNRPPPSRIGKTGENSAIFSWINKEPDCLCLF